MHSARMAQFPTMNQNTLTASTEYIGVILAGGKSSRMGQDKATLCINGESLLLRTRNTLINSGCTQILLSGFVRPGWSDVVIPDLYPNSGPVGGIVSTLQRLMNSGISQKIVLFVPIDAPLLSSDLLASMMNTASEIGCFMSESPMPFVLKTNENVFKQLALTISDIRAGKSCSVKRFIERLNLMTIPSTDARISQLLNVNTPAEWEGVCRELKNRT